MTTTRRYSARDKVTFTDVAGAEYEATVIDVENCGAENPADEILTLRYVSPLVAGHWVHVRVHADEVTPLPTDAEQLDTLRARVAELEAVNERLCHHVEGYDRRVARYQAAWRSARKRARHSDRLLRNARDHAEAQRQRAEGLAKRNRGLGEQLRSSETEQRRIAGDNRSLRADLSNVRASWAGCERNLANALRNAQAAEERAARAERKLAEARCKCGFNADNPGDPMCRCAETERGKERARKGRSLGDLIAKGNGDLWRGLAESMTDTERVDCIVRQAHQIESLNARHNAARRVLGNALAELQRDVPSK